MLLLRNRVPLIGTGPPNLSFSHGVVTPSARVTGAVSFPAMRGCVVALAGLPQGLLELVVGRRREPAG